MSLTTKAAGAYLRTAISERTRHGNNPADLAKVRGAAMDACISAMRWPERADTALFRPDRSISQQRDGLAKLPPHRRAYVLVGAAMAAVKRGGLR